MNQIEAIQLELEGNKHTWSIVKPIKDEKLISFDNVFEGYFFSTKSEWKTNEIKTILKLTNAFQVTYLYLWLLATATNMSLSDVSFNKKVLTFETNLKASLLKKTLKKCEQLYNNYEKQIPLLVKKLKETSNNFKYETTLNYALTTAICNCTIIEEK
ncbi:MAG: hypothetical protein V1855_02250 [bacterium]